jgi:uncharacterized membrane protein
MSTLAPPREWTLSAAVAIALTVTMTVVSLPRVAHADVGDEPSSKPSDLSQVEDNDKPKDPSLLEKKPADAAVQQQAVPSAPFYENWKFWAIAGVVVVGTIALIVGGYYLSHSANGGDVRPCAMDFQGRCFGEGH